MSIFNTAFSVMSLILLLICIALVGYVATNKPRYGQAANFTTFGVVLILVSQFLQTGSGGLFFIIPFDSIDVFLFVTSAVSNVCWVGGIVALLKAVYAASNQESSTTRFETSSDYADRPPFNVAHQQDPYP